MDDATLRALLAGAAPTIREFVTGALGEGDDLADLFVSVVLLPAQSKLDVMLGSRKAAVADVASEDLPLVWR